MVARSPASRPAFSPARRPTDVGGGGPSYGYLSINGQRSPATVDEGDEVTFAFVPGPGFPAGTVTAWALFLDGESVAGESSEFSEYIIGNAAESDAGLYRLEVTVGGKVVRVSAVLAITPAVYDADALDYFTRAQALGGSFDLSALNATYTEVYVKTAISDFIAGCKTDAIWTKLTEVYLLAGVTFGGLMAKLKHAGTATLTNNGPFVSGDYLAAGSGAGLVGNGTTKRLVSSVPIATLRSLFTYNTLGASQSSSYIGVDSFPSVNRVRLGFDLATNATTGNIGGNNTNRVNGNTQQIGALIITRQSETALKLFSNGSLLNTYAVSVAFTSPSALPIQLFAENINGAPGSFGNHKAVFAGYGTGLTDTDAANLSTRVNALMTALGANVY
jgi:hypothetical protein